jgi:hypothetical protein
VVLAADDLRVDVLEGAVTVGVCVSTTNVEGRPVRVEDTVRVLEGEGYMTGPPPDGGTTRVAVMTPCVG